MKKNRISLLLVAVCALLLIGSDVLARGGGGFSSGSGNSYGGGGSRGSGGGGYKPSSPSYKPSAPSYRPSAPSSGNSSSLFGGGSPGRKAVAPAQAPKTNYDSGAASSLHSEQSQRDYLRANPGALNSSAKDSNYYARQRSQNLSPNLTEETMGNRQVRQQSFYSDYYSRPVPMGYRSYNDGMNIWFWMWLLDRPQYRDQYIYHHQGEMDPSRLADLKAKDADLENRLKNLEGQGVKRDPNYIPPGVDSDLVYSDDEVKRVYAEKTKSHSGFGVVLLLLGLSVVGIIGFVLLRRPKEKSYEDFSGTTADRERKSAPTAPKIHDAFYNPLKAEIGGFVSVPCADLDGHQFSLIEIDDYTRNIAGKNHKFADYICQDGETWVTLRVNPITGGDPYATKKQNILALYPHRKFDYDEQFHKETLTTGVLEVKDDDGNVVATYTRLHGLKDPYTAEVAAFKDPEEPYEEAECDYWDFAREVDGKTEFYFVEMDKEDGKFTTYRGVEVEDIDILPAP